MFHLLLRQIAVTGIAYGIVSGVGLLLAPFLISVYSLGGYGQILIARTFLPSGFLSMLDFGMGETTTRYVASARVDGEWRACSGALALLALIALTLGAVLGLAIYVGAEKLTEWFDIAPDQRLGFVRVLVLTAVLQPLLMLALVAEGVLKGFENFATLRAIEIVAALFQAGSAIYFGLTGWGPNWVAAGLLASLVLRFVFAAAASLLLLSRQGVKPAAWTTSTRNDIGRWTRTMFSSKIVGTLQNQLASPLIGLLLSPPAVGLYDVVVRLPRFVKIVFGLVSSTVLPLASRLRSSNDRASTGRLGYYGMLATLTLGWPFSVTCATFSEPLLKAWIGPEVAQFWIWQSVMFVITMTAMPLSFGGAIALADRDVARRLVRLSAVQTAIQYPIALLLLGRLDQWAFVLGQAIAVLTTFPLQYRLLRGSLYIDRNLPVRMVLVLSVSLGVSIALAALHFPASTIELLAMGGGSTVLATALCAVLVLNTHERGHILAMVGRRFRPAV